MKLLFFHNTLAEYRIGFFNELNKICELEVVFTDYDIGENVYKNKIDETKIEFKYDILSGSKKDRIKSCIKKVKNLNPDWIIIPALDDLYSVSLGRKLLKISHSKNIKVGFFWEKWRWNYSDMPLSRRIKEIAQKFLVSPIVRNCDVLMAPGRKTAEYLRSCGADANAIYKVHDSSEVKQNKYENIYKKYDICEERKIVLFLGRMVYLKGLDNLIHAFANLSKDYLDGHVLLACGDGPERENCEKLRDQYGLNNIIFTGSIVPMERGSYYGQSSVFVLPDRAYKGRTDAWGLALNEAMQYNNILISTTAVGAAYELINESNGFMVEENSINELSEALLLADKEDLKDKAEIENRHLFELYNFKSMAKDFIDSLEGNGSCICS